MDDIEVSMEMISGALTWINENHDGESIPMAQLIHEAYLVMEHIRRKRIALDREMAIARAASGVMGRA